MKEIFEGEMVGVVVVPVRGSAAAAAGENCRFSSCRRRLVPS